MAGKYLKKCPVCGGPTTHTKTAYTIGNLVIEPEMETDVCAKCGEFYTAEQVAQAQEKAAALGVAASQLEEERELKKIGGSLFVSIPSTMARIMGLSPDERVKIKMTKHGISITKTVPVEKFERSLKVNVKESKGPAEKQKLA